MNTTYICYVAAKSGGHIIPAITHAEKELQDNPHAKILFFSADGELDHSILKNYLWISRHIPLRLANVPRKRLLAWPMFCVQLILTLLRVFFTLMRYRPEKVVSMGGYLSIPVCLVARILRIPIHVYELNVVPGEAVKLVSKWANVTHLCFEKTKYYLPKRALCKLGTYPLRYCESDRYTREEACKKLGLDPAKKTICILGGSQGARFINRLLNAWAQEHENIEDYQIIHQTGARDIESVKRAYRSTGIAALVFGYRNDLHVCYAAADQIVARAGAGTLFEILFFKKPAVIIPLEAATTAHQVDNARAMQAAYPEFFTVMRQVDIQKNPDLLYRTFALSN